MKLLKRYSGTANYVYVTDEAQLAVFTEVRLDVFIGCFILLTIFVFFNKASTIMISLIGRTMVASFNLTGIRMELP